MGHNKRRTNIFHEGKPGQEDELWKRGKMAEKENGGLVGGSEAALFQSLQLSCFYGVWQSLVSFALSLSPSLSTPSWLHLKGRLPTQDEGLFSVDDCIFFLKENGDIVNKTNTSVIHVRKIWVKLCNVRSKMPKWRSSIGFTLLPDPNTYLSCSTLWLMAAWGAHIWSFVGGSLFSYSNATKLGTSWSNPN